MKPLMKFVPALLFVLALHACNAQEQSLPKGLRFETRYKPWYLTGMPHEPVEHIFKIHLEGQGDVLKTVRSVNYELSKAKGARITHRIQESFYVEGAIPVEDSTAVIVATLRMKNGKKSTHKISLRPK